MIRVEGRVERVEGGVGRDKLALRIVDRELFNLSEEGRRGTRVSGAGEATFAVLVMDQQGALYATVTIRISCSTSRQASARLASRVRPQHLHRLGPLASLPPFPSQHC